MKKLIKRLCIAIPTALFTIFVYYFVGVHYLIIVGKTFNVWIACLSFAPFALVIIIGGMLLDSRIASYFGVSYDE